MGWNGKYNKQLLLDADTYIYGIEATRSYRKLVSKTGTLILIR
jgi:hypothetical protein